MNVMGVDACKLGWCGVGVIQNEKVWGCFESLNSLTLALPNLNRILIDIPIGLSSETFTRTIDSKARTYLQYRKSSIFSPPCREVVYVDGYKEALSLNQTICGKGISIQAYYICPKIKETDKWYETKPNSIEAFEAHPELCFKTLNRGKDLKFSKHNKSGIEERLEILLKIDKSIKLVYNDFLKKYKRSQVKRDDILDAMALMMVGVGKTELKYFEDENPIDASGKPVRIVYG